MWDSVGPSPKVKPRRSAAVFPEVPDPQEELERQRINREQRRKPRTGRRGESKVEAKAAPTSDPDYFSIRQLVDEDEERERRKDENLPQTIGRGNFKRIRNDRGADRVDEQIGE